MKKIFSLLISFLLLFPLFISTVYAQNISIEVDGKNLITLQAPIIKDGRVLVPLRGIFEELEAIVSWDAKTKIITAWKDSIYIELKIDSTQARVNGAEVTLDVPAQIVNGSTMVPLRFIGEALGKEVEWNSMYKLITVRDFTQNSIIDIVHGKYEDKFYVVVYFDKPIRNYSEYVSFRMQGKGVQDEGITLKSDEAIWADNGKTLILRSPSMKEGEVYSLFFANTKNTLNTDSYLRVITKDENGIVLRTLTEDPSFIKLMEKSDLGTGENFNVHQLSKNEVLTILEKYNYFLIEHEEGSYYGISNINSSEKIVIKIYYLNGEASISIKDLEDYDIRAVFYELFEAHGIEVIPDEVTKEIYNGTNFIFSKNDIGFNLYYFEPGAIFSFKTK